MVSFRNFIFLIFMFFLVVIQESNNFSKRKESNKVLLQIADRKQYILGIFPCKYRKRF